MRTRSRHLVLRISARIEKADVLAHVCALGGDDFERIRTLECRDLERFLARRRKPQWRFKAVADAEYRVLLFLPVVERRCSHRAGGRPLLVRTCKVETVLVELLGLGRDEVLRELREARHVEPEYVVLRLAVNHPLRKREPHAAALAEARHAAAGSPVVALAAHRPDQRVAIGREREGTVHDALDAGIAHAWETLESPDELVLEFLEIRLEQVGLAVVPRRAGKRPRRRVLFVYPEKHAG